MTFESACSLGFAELFALAHEREWTAEERAAFYALDQPERNTRVMEWAREAGGIHTEDRRGADGIIYKAFWRAPAAPERSPKETR